MAALRILILFSAVALAFSNPPKRDKCPRDKEWSDCIHCTDRCGNKDAFCAQSCTQGCKCKEPGYLLDRDNKCVHKQKCPSPPPPNNSCPKGAVLDNCAGCSAYCKTKKPCGYSCTQGCRCTQKGYVIGPSNTCIPEGKCPRW
ncbi:venom serine protease inhibitor-like [Engystomops pustulosus]|uniref:venom serine protease inhibitor-like n=1 Tax=Engystomops pustulosus TaxID=76066 RepID=UPI003AFB80CF